MKNEKSRSSPHTSPSRRNKSPHADRDNYVAYLEGKLDELSTVSLEVESISAQMNQLDERLKRIESSFPREQHNQGWKRSDSSSSQSIQFELFLERLRRLEDTVDRERPAVLFPNVSLDGISSRLEEIEKTTSSLADTASGEIQNVHSEISSLRSEMSEVTRKQVTAAEQRLHNMLSEGIEKISVVLRKLVAVQKSITVRH